MRRYDFLYFSDRASITNEVDKFPIVPVAGLATKVRNVIKEVNLWCKPIIGVGQHKFVRVTASDHNSGLTVIRVLLEYKHSDKLVKQYDIVGSVADDKTKYVMLIIQL